MIASPPWQPYREPFRSTIRRTGGLAIAIGGVVAIFWGGLQRWPIAALLALWPALGGHWVEIWFLNWLRPRISAGRILQIGARFAVWFAGGAVLAQGMRLTAGELDGVRMVRWPAWWIGGLAFIGIELIAHWGLQLRGRASFYNGRG